jgi:hypothetical protein
MELALDADTGRWTGSIRNSRRPDESQELLGVTVDDRRVTFHTVNDLPDQDIKIRSEFDLLLRQTGDELKGAMQASMPGMQIPEVSMTWTRIVEQIGTDELSFQASRPLIGAWSAQPDKDDREREMVLEILPDGDDYLGTLTDTGLDQTTGLRDLVINERERTVSFNFLFTSDPFLSSFWGRYDEERDRVRGSLSKGGSSQPLAFERTSPGPESLRDDFDTRRPLVRKHDYRFAVTVRGARWVPLYVMKEKVRNINDITSPTFSFDAGLRFHLLDYLALQARMVRGGVGLDTNARNLGLFHPETIPQGDGLSRPLTTDAFIALDGYEFSLVTFLGQSIMPDSKFNPYLIAVMGRTDWELNSDGRSGEIIAIADVPLTGTDWTFGGGLGTEYAVSKRFGLELEWVWAYTTTQDETKWEDITFQWTSQHVFRLSLGGIVWF